MSVEFNDESNQNKVLYGRFAQSSQAPKLVTWLLKIGIVKNESQANFVLINIAIISIILAIYIPLSKNIGAPIKFKEDIPENVRSTIPPEIFNNLPTRNQ
jgi:hypothetical protein